MNIWSPHVNLFLSAKEDFIRKMIRPYVHEEKERKHLSPWYWFMGEEKSPINVILRHYIGLLLLFYSSGFIFMHAGESSHIRVCEYTTKFRWWNSWIGLHIYLAISSSQLIFHNGYRFKSQGTEQLFITTLTKINYDSFKNDYPWNISFIKYMHRISL